MLKMGKDNIEEEDLWYDESVGEREVDALLFLLIFKSNFSGAVLEVVVNLMWKESALLLLSAPPLISRHPT